jgi:hypothetical protein
VQWMYSGSECKEPDSNDCMGVLQGAATPMDTILCLPAASARVCSCTASQLTICAICCSMNSRSASALTSVIMGCPCVDPMQWAGTACVVCILPHLQVFMVRGKGWGCRCSMDIPAGAVLCRYIGVVITEE